MEYNKKYNVNIRICRIFNTYGPNLNPKDGRVISNFINQSINNKDIIILLTNSKSNISYEELPKDDPKIRNPDLILSKKVLNWEQKINIENGLLKMIEYYRTKKI